MDNFKKFVLIDPRLLDRPRVIDKILTPKDRAMTSMEYNMNDILNDDRLPPDLKAKLFSSAQTRYLAVDAPDPTSVKAPVPTQRAKEEKETVDPETLLESLPKNLRAKAKRLVDFIGEKTDVEFKTNGEIILDGKTISNSNATELIKNVLGKGTGSSPGLNKFVAALKDANAPKEFLKSHARKSSVSEESVATRSKTEKKKQIPPRWEKY